MYRIIAFWLYRLEQLSLAMGRTLGPWRTRFEILLAKRRRVVATIVSLGLHCLLVTGLLMSMALNTAGGQGGAATGTGANAGNGIGVSVELVSIHAVVSDDLTVKVPDQDEMVDLKLPQVADVKSENAVIDMSAVQFISLKEAPGTEADSLATANSANEYGAGAAGKEGQSSGVSDALWKQIEPCWDRLADPGAKDVRLRVNFSPLGNVAQTVDASDVSAAPHAHFRAEAVQALAECGPYVSSGSQENVVITFPSTQ